MLSRCGERTKVFTQKNAFPASKYFQSIAGRRAALTVPHSSMIATQLQSFFAGTLIPSCSEAYFIGLHLSTPSLATAADRSAGRPALSRADRTISRVWRSHWPCPTTVLHRQARRACVFYLWLASSQNSLFAPKFCTRHDTSWGSAEFNHRSSECLLARERRSQRGLSAGPSPSGRTIGCNFLFVAANISRHHRAIEIGDPNIMPGCKALCGER